MSKWSWALMSVAALAVASCGPPSADLSPRRATAPEWPYGLVVGVVAVARTPGTTASAARDDVNAYMTYRQSHGGASGDLLLSSDGDFASPGVYGAVEDGLRVWYRPFALKLPAVSTELVSLDIRWSVPRQRQELQSVSESYKDAQGKWQTRSELKWVTVTYHVPMSRGKDLPANRFEVVAGKVHYIGRVGMVVNAEQARGPAATRVPFLENQETADLAMIRKYFPKLAGVEIEVRPFEVAPGSWPTLSEATRRNDLVVRSQPDPLLK